ncbi:hypothetical protein ABU614_10735 [Lysobacter firmicutimachus]|uniref:Uncharacterized protein n=1 Tax=Lysobacter firmicutimachus TaxID=1792846 RepID=A0AAU8N160_9GAMM
MGRIEFEGWGVELDDIDLLNRSPETSRLGLVFEQFPGVVCAAANGNVSAYYVILMEVRRRLLSGAFNVKVQLSNGEQKIIMLGNTFATEDGDDLTDLICP